MISFLEGDPKLRNPAPYISLGAPSETCRAGIGGLHITPDDATGEAQLKRLTPTDSRCQRHLLTAIAIARAAPHISPYSFIFEAIGHPQLWSGDRGQIPMCKFGTCTKLLSRVLSPEEVLTSPMSFFWGKEIMT